ncbi:hypothetical protein llap_10553 [Limosa lapponica baueri]|uniref:Rna-directed dna polymerase from mobile element jockey-like n=1 Tax=Limosa lapponica baueri TaxID=1758121 RepID=A0A2I0TZK5_LIMLA|nr:hypothetical protein llap_10553 [Limosa lapponica baueri]
MDLLLAKSELISNTRGVFVITYLRKVKKCTAAVRERSEKSYFQDYINLYTSYSSGQRICVKMKVYMLVDRFSLMDDNKLTQKRKTVTEHWNRLPTEIAESPFLKIFKNAQYHCFVEVVLGNWF